MVPGGSKPQASSSSVGAVDLWKYQTMLKPYLKWIDWALDLAMLMYV